MPEAYAYFVHRGVGKGNDYTKVILRPALDRAAEVAQASWPAQAR